MAYATAADLIDRFDARRLGDLVSDNGVRVAEGSLSGNSKLEACLDDASGMVDAALLVGKRYTTTDLTNLTGNSAKYLKRIVCDIAMALLEDRRRHVDDQARAAALEKAQEHLELLRKGSHVFDVDSVKEAGVIDGTVGPTRVELASSHLVRHRTKNYYPPARTPGNR